MRYLLIWLTLYSLSASAIDTNSVLEKVLPAGPESPNMDVTLESTKARYWVDEAIQLKLVATYPCYVYLFKQNPETLEAELLFPNNDDEEHRFQGTNILPNKQVEIYGDKPGMEHMYMLATLQPQPWREFKQVPIDNPVWYRGLNLRNLNGMKKQGFTTAEVSFMVVDETL